MQRFGGLLWCLAWTTLAGFAIAGDAVAASDHASTSEASTSDSHAEGHAHACYGPGLPVYQAELSLNNRT